MPLDKKSNKAIQPAYVPFKTFKNFLEGREKPPSVVDRSVLGTMSGSVQSQLVAALKFLKLIDGGSRPTANFEKLVSVSEEEWASNLREVVLEAYGPLLGDEIDLKTTTTGAVQKKLAETRLGASTVDKAIAFLIAALKESKSEFSPDLRPPRRPPKNRRERGGNSSGEDEGRSDAERRIEDGMVFIPIPVPQLGVVAEVVLPEQLTQETWEMIQEVMSLYAKALIKGNQVGDYNDTNQ